MSDWGDFEGGPSGGRVLRARGDEIHALSPSSITTFLTCPEQYRQSYILGNWPPTYPAMILGTAYHYAIQKNYEQKMWSEENMLSGRVEDAYDEGWNLAVARNDVEWGKADEAVVHDLGMQMAVYYVRDIAMAIIPLGVEEKIEYRVEGVPVPVIGYVDVRTRNRIIDTKTINKTGRTYTPQEKWKVAALIYMAAHAECNFEWHVHGKDDWHTIQTAETTPTMQLFNTRARRETAEALVKVVWQQMEEMSGRYGAEQTWPGTGLVHHGVCGACFQRRRCAWQR